MRIVALLPFVMTLAVPVSRVHQQHQPAPKELSYTFRVSNDKSSNVMSGIVYISGDRMRIDTDRIGKEGEYILLTDGGTRMLTVHPDSKKMQRMNTSDFEKIVGSSLKVVSPIVQFRVLNPKITVARVGTGEMMLGHATEHMRITESFDVGIHTMGFTASTEHHTVTADYWVSPGLELGSNPLLSLIMDSSNPMTQTDRSFMQQRKRVQEATLEGTPLRTVIKSVSTGDDSDANKNSTSVIEITSIKVGAQPASLFQVPTGYTMTKGASAFVGGVRAAGDWVSPN